MKTYEPDDEVLAIYVRLRHETLPVHPPAAVVELPDWQDTAPLPVVQPAQSTSRRWWLPAALIIPTCVNAGYWIGTWVR